MPTTVDGDDLDALKRACGGYSGSRADASLDSADVTSRDAAMALSSLADGDVLEGLATGDMAMTMVKMLAVCVGCDNGSPSVPAVAFDDRPDEWFDLSMDLCHACFTIRAVRLRAAARDAGGHAGHLAATNGGVSGEASEADKAFVRIGRLVQRGTLRALSIWSGESGNVQYHSVSPTLPVAIIVPSADNAPVNAVAYSPDGMTMVTVSDDVTVRVWNVASKKRVRAMFGHNDCVNAVTFSPDGGTIATASDDRTVRLWDAASGECRHVLQGHTDWVGAVACLPDGTIVTGSDDDTLRLWDATSGECRRVLRGHTDSVNGVACSPDGTTIASASDDETLRLWDAVTGTCRRALRGHTDWVNAVVYSPDGAMIATGSADDTVRLWDAVSGECRAVLRGHTDSIDAVVYSPDERTLVTTGDDETLRLWDAATGECQHVLVGSTDSIFGVAYSPDGATITTASDDGTVRLWGIGRWRHSGHWGRWHAADGGWLDSASPAMCDNRMRRPSPPQQHRERTTVEAHGDQQHNHGMALTDGMVMDDVTARVSGFYDAHNPDLVGPAAVKIVRNYNGQYGLLADVLSFKYLGRLPESSDLLPSSPGFVALMGGLVLAEDTMSSEHVAHQLREFLERHDPSRVDDVPRLMKLYAGCHRTLFDSINAATFDLPPVAHCVPSSGLDSRPPPQWPDLDVDETNKQVLGQGAFGVVYRVYSRFLMTDVAMKCVHLKPQDDRDKIEDEAIAMRELADCPHIIRVLSFQCRPCEAVTYMELMPGGSLEDLVKKEGAQWEGHCRLWIRDMLRALKRLHSVDLVHRDVKPANALLDGNGRVKLGDFGLLKDVDETAHSAGDPRGTAQYLAPELMTMPGGRGLEYTAACDVWSLGCTWLRLLTGKDPWAGVIDCGDGDLPQLARQLHLALAVTTNTTLLPIIPPWLSTEARDLLGRMLQRDPEERIVVEGLLRSTYFTRGGVPGDCETHETFVARVRSAMGPAAATSSDEPSYDAYDLDVSDGGVSSRESDS